MNSGFQPSFMQGASFQNPNISGIPIPGDYDPTHQFNPALLYDYVSSSPSTLSIPPNNQTTTQQSAISSVDDRPVYPTLPPATNPGLANINTNMNAFQNSQSTPAATDQWEELARQWDVITQNLTSPQMVNPAPQYSYYPQTTTHSHPPAQPAATTASFDLSAVQPQPQLFLPQTSFPQDQAMTSGGSASNPGPIRHGRTTSGFPQAGPSAGSIHQRRSQRNNALGPSQETRAHHRAQSSTHARRSRPSSMASSTPYPIPQTPQPHPAHSQENQAANHNPSTPSPARPEHQNQPTQPHPSFSRTAGIGGSVQSEEWMRYMRPNHLRHFQEQALARASRGDPSLVPPFMHKKVLDTAQDSRPDPKGTSELTINMECKICMEQLVDTVLLPCGHAILCRWCANQQIPSTKGFPKGREICPMCRGPVRHKHRIYFP